MILQRLDSGIILRVLAVFVIGVVYGILDKGKFNGLFIGDGLSHLVLSYFLGLISFYAYKFITRKSYPDKKKRKAAKKLGAKAIKNEKL